MDNTKRILLNATALQQEHFVAAQHAIVRYPDALVHHGRGLGFSVTRCLRRKFIRSQVAVDRERVCVFAFALGESLFD